MKIAFLQKDSFVKISVMLLCAVLKEKGHKVEVFIESGERNFIKAVVDSRADIFAFSLTTGRENWVSRVAGKLKEKCDTPVLVGGPHATFFPEFIRDENIDWLCRGEGEDVLIDLIETLASRPENAGRLPNIFSVTETGEIRDNGVRRFIADLDRLPFPDFSPYTKYKYLVPYNREMYPVMTGRGCPNNCSYCFNRSYKEIYRGKGRYIRQRSPENVIGELRYIKKTFGIRKLNFVDDSFFNHPSWLAAFAPLYISEVALPFIINVEASQVKEELVRLIKNMGCICVRMGVETGNEHLRRHVLKKKVTDSHIRAAAALFKKYRIKLSTFNILGIPGESLDDAMATYALNREIRSDLIQCSLLQPYPGTEINRYVEENGFIDENSDSALEESFFATTHIKLQNKKELVNLQKLIQIMSRLNASEKLVRFLIKFPENVIFSALFKISFIYSKMKIQRIKILPIVRLGLHSLGYMKQK